MTLVELVLAMTLGASVMVMVGHIVTQMTRTVTVLERKAQNRTELQLAIHRMRRELRNATAISEVTPTRIAFAHLDADGDGDPDVVTFDWGGTPGDPLTRQLNQDDPEDLVEACTSFSVDAAALSAAVVDKDDLLASHDVYPPAVLYVTETFGLSGSRWAGEYFTINHGTAASFRITRVLVYMKASLAIGTATVRLHTVSGNDPTSTTLDAATKPLVQVSTAGAWEEFTMSSTPSLALGSYALTIRTNGITIGASASYDRITTGTPPATGDFFRSTTNSGSSWSPSTSVTSRDLKYYVYGHYLDGSGDRITTTTSAVDLVELRIEVGSGSDAFFLDTTVHCLNQPEQTQ